MNEKGNRGFTLIELSIVLVIIGLIVGGVLFGRDMIKAAEVRATITQIEKYNQAANAFYGKYGALPGDISLSNATQFGLTTVGCTGGAGLRDGNGLLDAFSNISESNGSTLGYGEPALFWNDLSATGLIDGSFTIGTCSFAGRFLSQTPLVMPQSKAESGSYIYVYDYNYRNFFGMSQINSWQNTYEVSSGNRSPPPFSSAA